MTRKTTRRDMLRESLAVGAAVGFFTSNTLQSAERSANEKLNIGIIGAAGRGADNAQGVQSENIAALCDVNEQNLAQAAARYPHARTYADWRELVEQKDLNAVVISTTDHTHALAGVWAMNRGLSVYCEKPLAHSVYEARMMQDKYLANQHRLATQMGTQIHATDNYRRVVELIQSGAIGPVREAHVWCGRQGLADGERPKEEQPVPAHLNWDLWLGPAPARPYHARYLPGCMTWEQWWDFGNGCLGDMGSHLIDLPFWALKLRDPLSVEAEGSPLRARPTPSGSKSAGNTPRAATCRRSRCTGTTASSDPSPLPAITFRIGASACSSSATTECCWPTTANGFCCLRRSSRTSNRRRPPFPRR